MLIIPVIPSCDEITEDQIENKHTVMSHVERKSDFSTFRLQYDSWKLVRCNFVSEELTGVETQWKQALDSLYATLYFKVTI